MCFTLVSRSSLTVEVLRAKGPNPAQDRDPIFERGSTTTYSSFRKGTYTKPWSNEGSAAWRRVHRGVFVVLRCF